MRVSLPTIFGNIQAQLQRLAEDIQNTNADISTGRKYQTITDNPVEVGGLMGLNVESGQVVQYQRNLDTAKDWLQGTTGTLSNINSLVQSTIALTSQMATGTYTAAQRAGAAQQVQQYLEEVMQMGNTRYQGHYLLSGYKIDTKPFATEDFAIQAPEMHLMAGSDGAATSSGTYTGTGSATYVVEIVAGGATGAATYRVSEDGGRTWTDPAATAAGPLAIGSQGAQVSFDPTSANWVARDRFTVSVYQPISYQGDDNSLELAIGRDSRLEVSQVGSQAVGGAGGQYDLFQIMARLKSNLEANDAGEVGARLEELKEYQSDLTSNLAGLGAALNRVEAKQNAYTVLQEDLTQNIAQKGDTDMVEAVNALSAKQTAYQAALLASTKVMEMSLVDFLQ